MYAYSLSELFSEPESKLNAIVSVASPPPGLPEQVGATGLCRKHFSKPKHCCLSLADNIQQLLQLHIHILSDLQPKLSVPSSISVVQKNYVMEMDFNSSASFSLASCGDEENQGENTHVPAGTGSVGNRKVRLLLNSAEGDEGNEAFSGQHPDVKLEVPETPTFQTDDEAELHITDPQIKKRPTELLPKTSSTFQNAKSTKTPPGKRKPAWNCRHCPYKTNNRFSYADHLKTHLNGSTASPCKACGIYVFQEDLNHQRFHRKSQTSNSNLEYYSSDDDEEDDSSDNFTSDDDNASSNSDDSDDTYDAGPEPSTTEVIDLGHFSSTPVFMDEEQDYELEIEPQENPQLDHSSGRRTSTTTSSTSRLYHTCPYCPYESIYSRCVEKHLKVHSQKGKSAPCRLCGVYVFQGKKCHCGSTPVRKKKKLNRKKVVTQNYSMRVHIEKSQPVVHYKCNHCSFTVKTSLKKIEDHAKLHKPTSRAIPCEICRVYVLPETMGRHKSRHPELPKTLRRKMKEANKKKREINRDFLSKYDAKKKRFYKCLHCGFRNNRLGDMESHVELHKAGVSAGVSCEICKQVMLPDEMKLHLETKHTVSIRQLRPPDKRRVTNPLLQCALCPHKSKIKKQALQHSELHLEGSGAICCPKCTVFHRPTTSNRNGHRLVCFKWQTVKRMRDKLAANQEENSSSGSLNAE